MGIRRDEFAETDDDIIVVFEPDIEWDVEPVKTTPEPQTTAAVACVKPWEKRAVQGCFCAKCTSFRDKR